MLLRDAITPPPHMPAVIRIAIATTVLTVLVVGGTLLVLMLRPIRDAPLPAVPTIHIASLRGAPAPAVDPAEVERTRRELTAYAHDAWPRWVVDHPGRECPHRLLELNMYLPALHAVDPWGTPYQFLCGAHYDLGARLVTRSAGPDRVFDTTDDLSSSD